MPSDLKQLPKRLGVAIRTLRKEADLSQEKLAERAGLTLNFTGEIERGEKLASLETVVRLGSALGMTGADLLKKAGL